MVKIGSAVHTAHGLGKVTEVDTVRGRKSYKVAGNNFAVWLDETKVAALGDVDESNSTTLPYDYTPQHPVETFSEESDFSPTYGIDADERTSPTNSVTGEGEDDPQPSPGPSPDLFAKSAGNDWPSEYDEDESDYTTEELAEMGERHSGEAEAMYREYLEDKARGADPYEEYRQELLRQPEEGRQDWLLNTRPKHAAGAWGDLAEEPEGGVKYPAKGSAAHYQQYALRNGLNPGSSLTADRYSREHGIPLERAEGFSMKGSIHEAYPGKHRKAPEPEVVLPHEAEVWDAEDWLAAHPEPKFADPREQARYEEWKKKTVKGDSELFDRYTHAYDPEFEGELISASRTAGADREYLEWCYENGRRPESKGSQQDYYQEHSPAPDFADLNLGGERVAGLSDKYIDLLPIHTAAHDDPVEQFRRDPITAIQRTAYLVESSTGLDPRMGQYMDLVDADPIIREAAWSDVRTKAMRLKSGGAVHVKDMAPNRIMASVDGDNATYDVVIYKGASLTGSNSIDQWHCGCEWGKWAFRRKHTFVGRLCSHGLAAYFTMQSAHQTGQPRQTKLPKKPTPRRSLPFLHVKRGSIVEDFKDWVRDVNQGHVDVGAADDFIALYPGDPTPDDINDVIEYAHDNPTQRPERNYESGTTFDLDKAYKSASEGIPAVLKNIPDRITPDYYVVPEGEDQKFIDVESDERKTTGPDQITARRLTAAPKDDEWSDEDFYNDNEAYQTQTDEQREDDRLIRERFKKSKVDKSWAKNHGKLDDEDTPIIRFSARKEALTYTADENLIQHLRDLSAEAPEESYGNKAERNAEVREVVQELRERGYDASQFVAMRRTADETEAVDYKKLYPRAENPAGGSVDYKALYPRGENPATTIQGPGLNGDFPGAKVQGPGLNGDFPKSGGDAVKNVNTSTPAAQSGGPGGGGGGGSDWTPNGNKDAIGAGDYKIQSGDTLTSISDRSGVGVDDLMKGNSQITNKDLIFADDTLKIPGTPAAGGEPPAAGAAEVGGAPPVEPGAAAPMSGVPGVPGVPGPTPDQPNAGPPPASPDTATFTPGAPVPPTAGGPSTASIIANSRRRYAEETGKYTEKGVPIPGNGPGMDQTPDVGSQREEPKTQTLEERLPGPGQSESTSDPMSALGGGSVTQMVGPVVNGITQGISGLAGGGGLSGLASGVGSALSGLFSFAAADNYGPTDTAPDPSFAGTGPYIKDWWTTSEDYIEEHEKDHWEDVTEGHGDVSNYTKPRQQPKQAGRDWDRDSVEGWVKRHDPNYRSKDKEQIRFVKGDDDDASDIVRQFQANIGNTALGAGAGGGGTFSDAAIAERAQGFLRTAGRVYSLAEQQELIDEAHPKGARNLSGLDLRGTHYLES